MRTWVVETAEPKERRKGEESCSNTLYEWLFHVLHYWYSIYVLNNTFLAFTSACSINDVSSSMT